MFTGRDPNEIKLFGKSEAMLRQFINNKRMLDIKKNPLLTRFKEALDGPIPSSDEEEE